MIIKKPNGDNGLEEGFKTDNTSLSACLGEKNVIVHNQ
jgi:hypothetical protein